MDKTLDFSRDISYNTKVLSAEYSEAENLWKVHTTSGDYTTKFFILCVGLAKSKYIPDFKGLHDFKGEYHHTSAWPRHVCILS